MSRLAATALAVVLAQHLLAGTNVDLGSRPALLATGVLLACAGLGLCSRRRVPYLGDGLAVAVLVPLRGPLCDLVRLAAPAAPASLAIAVLVSLGPLAYVLGRQLGSCLHGRLASVLPGLVAGEVLVMAGAVTWLPAWALGALVAAGLAALSEVGRARREAPAADREAPAALLLGASLALWIMALGRITSAYITPSAWPGTDAFLVMVLLCLVVAWPASALLPPSAPRARRVAGVLGAVLLAVALWSAIAELAIYRDQLRAVALARSLHLRASRLGPLGEWWLWLATFAGLRAAAGGLALGVLDVRSFGALLVGGGLAVLGLWWWPAGTPLGPSDPVLLPAAGLLGAAGLALAAAPAVAWGRRGLLLLPLAALPFLLVPAEERPRFDEVRRRGEFAVQSLRRTSLADVALYSTPDIDSVAVEGRAAADTSCTCQRVALGLTEDGELTESIDLRTDAARPCLGLRIGGLPLHAGHDPVGASGSAGRLLRVFAPRGRLLVSGVGAELLAADLHDAGLLEEGVVASAVPLGDEVAFLLLDALGSRVWQAAQVLDPLEAALEPGTPDLDGIVVPPEHAAWGSASLHAGREHLARLARRLRPGGRCLLFLDTSALDASALAARLSAFGAVFGERSAVFAEPRELDAPFVLALGWVDEAGRPSREELQTRLAGLEGSSLRTRMTVPEELSALLLRDGTGMGAGRSPARRARPAPPGRWRSTGWAAVAAVTDREARLDRVVAGAEGRPGIDPDVLAGLAIHATYRYRLRDLNETTFSLPEDVDWGAFEAEAAHYAEAAARARDDPLLHLALAALLEPLAMGGDYGRFADVFEACGAREMASSRLALLEARVQRQTLEEDAADRALERARALVAERR